MSNVKKHISPHIHTLGTNKPKGVLKMENIDISAQFSRLILDSNPLAVAVLDRDMFMIDCNEAALKLLEISDKKKLMNDFFRYSVPIQPNGMFAGELARQLILDALDEMEKTAEWMFRNSKGEAIPCEVTSKRIDYDDTYIIILYIRDLRAEIEAQAEVKEITERNKIMIDVTPICFVFFDDEFHVVDCNPVALSLFEIPTKEIFIEKFFTLSPECQSNGKPSFESYKTNMQKAFNLGRLVFEWDHITVSGEALPVEVTLVRVEYRSSYRIAGYFRDLREHRAMLDEMHLVEQQLRVAKEIAEESVKVKTEFLANMSHEIRTPMNAVLGVTEIMIQYEQLPDEIEEGLEKIYTACDMLLGIINDILDFSKIEAGKLDILPANYLMASLINDSVHLNMMRIDSKPIEFELMLGKDIPENLIGDELRIKQIINNTLSNAFKYTDAGKVTMSVEIERESIDDPDKVMLVLVIRDTGHGMTKDQLDKLFDEYSRFHEGTSKTIEGTGLGLAITRRLISLMNGEIEVESEKGTGTTVTVRLPQGIVDDNVISDEVSENLSKLRQSHINHRKRRRVEREIMPYGSVLIVDDVETNLYVATGLMNPYNLKIETALRGREAINKVNDGKVYDIIFMDHMMPEMDGIETTKHLRDSGYTQPIIALTANAVSGQADMFLQNGFDDFISKPIDIRQLDMVLVKYIRDKQPPEVLEAVRKEINKAIPAGDETTQVKSLLLESFIRDARNSLTSLENLCKESKWTDDENSLRKYTITVHGMKSSLWNISETELSEMAYSLETGVRERDIKLISEATPRFLNELRTLLDKMETSQKSNEDFADNDPEDIPEKLFTIGQMCADYNRSGVLKLISEIDNCTEKTKALLQEIKKLVINSDYEEAEEAITAYLSDLQ